MDLEKLEVALVLWDVGSSFVAPEGSEVSLELWDVAQCCHLGLCSLPW